MSEDDILETGLTASGNVYRVTPLDRDAGGRGGDHPFDTFGEAEDQEEEERKAREREERRQKEARLARQREDRISLSVTALKAIGLIDPAADEEAHTPQAPATPQRPPASAAPKRSAGSSGDKRDPADRSGANASHSESPPRVDFVA
jgi:hypothetical protein